MTSFDWNLFEKGWLEVNCKNEELASDFISKCAKKGIKWLSGNEISPLDVHTWLKYKENTVYGLYDGKMYLKNGTKRKVGLVEWTVKESISLDREWITEQEKYNYTLEQIFEFPVGTLFQDQQGNRYKISEQFETKTLTYPVVTQNIVQAKFKLI